MRLLITPRKSSTEAHSEDHSEKRAWLLCLRYPRAITTHDFVPVMSSVPLGFLKFQVRTMMLTSGPGPLFEGNPVGEGTTRRGTATPVPRPQRPAGSTHSSTRGLRPPEQLERPAGFPSSDKTRSDSPVPTLQGPCGRSPKRRGIL